MPHSPLCSSSELATKITSRDSVPPLSIDVPLEQQHRLEVRREHPLVVDRAAAVEVVALDLGGERIDRPVLALDADDVHVRHDEHGLLAAVALDPRDERAAARRRLEQMRLDPRRLERAVEIARDLQLVARRIHRVHPDHRLQVLQRLLARGVPVGLLGGGDRGSGGERHQSGGDERMKRIGRVRGPRDGADAHDVRRGTAAKIAPAAAKPAGCREPYARVRFPLESLTRHRIAYVDRTPTLRRRARRRARRAASHHRPRPGAGAAEARRDPTRSAAPRRRP